MAGSPTTPDAGAVSIPAAVAELLAEAADATSGRAARTLTTGAGAPLKQTLLALTRGTVLADHESPGAATLHVLAGIVRLTVGDDDTVLHTGAHTALPAVRHGLESVEDAVVLLTVAQHEHP